MRYFEKIALSEKTLLSYIHKVDPQLRAMVTRGQIFDVPVDVKGVARLATLFRKMEKIQKLKGMK